MAGLVRAIHVFVSLSDHRDVDARDKRGHDPECVAILTQNPYACRISADELISAWMLRAKSTALSVCMLNA
jgi:hypothetical protein